MKTRNRSRYFIRKRRIYPVLLSVFIALTFFLSACSILEFGTAERTVKEEEELFLSPENGEYLNEVESVRTLILAMQNTDKIESVWRHIPSKQRSEISLSQFVNYVNILNQLFPNDIVSFSKTTADESNAMSLNISRSIPGLSEEADRSSFWYINTLGSNNQQDKCVISINKTAEGIPYFSSAWITRLSFIYDYVNFYFSALEEENSAALYDLLHQQHGTNLPYYEQATRSRVSGLLSFYSEFNTMQLRSYRISELLPGNARVVQSNLPGGTGSRTVYFRESNAVISVSEKIPQDLDLRDTRIYLDDKPSFRLEDNLHRLSSVVSLPELGIPLDIRLITDDEDTDSASTSQGEDVFFRVSWPGVQIDAFGDFDAESLLFDGIIKRIDIFYSDYETGNGFGVGDPINLLYSKYPFARENEYLIRSEQEGATLTLAVQVESDRIARLTILSEEAE